MQPGAEQRHGRRLRALGDAFHRTVKYALRGADAQQFAACFPGYPDAYVEVLYDAYKQTLHQTRAAIEADCEALCEENQLPDKLAALETLCEEQGVADGDTAVAPAADRPSASNPALAARLALLRAKQQETQQLQAILGEVQRQNEALAGQAAERRRAVDELAAKSQLPGQQLEEAHAASRMWANREVVPVG